MFLFLVGTRRVFFCNCNNRFFYQFNRLLQMFRKSESSIPVLTYQKENSAICYYYAAMSILLRRSRSDRSITLIRMKVRVDEL